MMNKNKSIQYLKDNMDELEKLPGFKEALENTVKSRRIKREIKRLSKLVNEKPMKAFDNSKYLSAAYFGKIEALPAKERLEAKTIIGLIGLELLRNLNKAGIC